MERLVDGFHRVGHGILQRVEQLFLARIGLSVEQVGHFAGDVGLILHERHKQVLVGQLLRIALGVETVDHVVVLHGGVGVDGRETAVVIGEDQAVGADHYARAIAAEVDHIVAQSVGCAVELGLTQLESLGPHLLIHGLRQVVERPHALVSLCLRAQSEHCRGKKK